MSVKMVDHIVDEHHIDIDSGMIKRVKVYLYSLYFTNYLVLSLIQSISFLHWLLRCLSPKKKKRLRKIILAYLYDAQYVKNLEVYDLKFNIGTFLNLSGDDTV